MVKEFNYSINGNDYVVVVTYKNVKNVTYKFRNGKFLVSANRFTSLKFIKNGLDKFGPKLIKNAKNKTAINDDSIYIFGILYPYYDFGEIVLISGEKISYKNKDDLLIKLRKLFLQKVSDRVRYYENMMNLNPYKVRVRNMITRYGVNSKQTKSLTFATLLLHYSINIIDSVVVHELAHEFYFDHSKNFYNIVYEYCPNYKYLHACLKRGDFHD